MTLNSLHHPALDPIFAFLSFIGTGGIIIPATLYAIWKWVPKQNVKRALIFAFIAFLIGFTTLRLIKDNVRRLRPFHHVYHSLLEQGYQHDADKIGQEEFVKENGDLIHIVGKRLNVRSFPSGHSMTPFIASSVLAIIFKRRFVSFFILSLLIGYSRIYVGAHFPLDCLMGAMIGLVSPVLAKIIYKP